MVTLQGMSCLSNKKGKKHILLRVLITLIFCPIILLWAIAIILYIPPIQKFAVEKICQVINETGEYNLSIGTFHLTFPLKVTINDFALSQNENIIVNGKQAEINIRPTALLKGEIEVNYISIDKTSLNTGNIIDGISIAGNIGHFRTTARNIDIADEKAVIRHLHIADTQLDITVTPTEDEESDSISAPVNWIVELNKGSIHNLRVNIEMPQDTVSISTVIDNLKLRRGTADLAKSTFGFSNFTIEESHISYDKGTAHDSIAPLDHIHIENIDLETDFIKYAYPCIDIQIDNLAFEQKGGMQMEECNISLHSDTTDINIENIALKTKNGSHIIAKSIIPWNIIHGKTGGNMQSDIAIYMNKNDLRGIISATNYRSLDFLPDSMLNARLVANGNLDRMAIDTIIADIPKLLTISSKGAVQHLQNSNNTDALFNIDGYIWDMSHLIQMQPTPDSITKHIATINGTVALHKEDADVALQLSMSNKGKADISAKYNISKVLYNAQAKIEKLNLHDIIPSLPIHEITMSMNAAGEGFDIFSSETHYNINAHIDTLLYDSINLQKIDFVATQAEKISNITLSSASPNLQMSLEAKTEIDSTFIENESQIIVTKADMQSFGIVDAPLTSEFTFDINVATDMQQTHKVNLTGDNFKLITQRQTFTPARLVFNGYTSPDTSFIKMNTGDLKIDGVLSSGYKKLISSIEHLSSLYSKARYSEKSIYYAQDFERAIPAVSIDIECGQKNILSNFLRFQQIEFSDFNFKLAIDSVKGINGNGGLHNLKKEDIQIDTIRFFMRQKEDVIRYFAGLRTRSLNPEQPKLKFYSAIFGSLHNDSLVTNFVFRDNNDHVGAKVGLNTILSPEGLDFHFTPEATLFNRPFRFNEDNYFSLRKDLAVNGFIELKDSLDSGLRIFTTNDSTQLRDISAELLNIDLKTVTTIIPFIPNMEGTLNADLHFRQDESSIMLSSDIRGKEIVYEGTLLGDETLELVYLPKNKDMHYIDVNLLHNNELVFNLYGDYYNDSIQSNIDGEAMLKDFPLKLSDAFLKDAGLKFDGYINGELAVKGSMSDIVANGFIHFDSVYANAPMLSTTLHLPNDQLNIANNKLIFKDFDIYAKGNTPFRVNGDIDFNKLINPIFNLRMRAKNYELINTKRNKDSMLYGKLSLDFNSFVQGPMNSLKVFGQATMLGNSNITYVMLDSPLATESELDGLVKFVNFADTTQVAQAEEEIDFGNITMNMTLNIEESARINADFDENRNNYIELQGGGSLYLTYTSETGIGLTGRYTLNNGTLKYTLPIIPLKIFNISEGSYINWTGELMNPTLNITALERMTSSVTMEDGNSQAVAFDVGVVLTNTLDNMGLNFTLSAPENAMVQDELNSVDKETLNKYAVTMLITGAYLGGNGGITVSNALSSFIDAKINDIAGNAMKSVDINVGITDVEDAETGGTYRNYSFSFAKRFWNDRLTVIIGGEVNSGNTNNQNESFINNVSLEWRINKTGNRYIRLFYDKNYESILEGEIIETGIGYVYKRKLDNLKELFIFRKKDEQEMLMINSHNGEK